MGAAKHGSLCAVCAGYAYNNRVIINACLFKYSLCCVSRLLFGLSHGKSSASLFSLVNFVTISFVLFFLPALCIGWGLRANHRAYKWFLLLVNLLFYWLAGGPYIIMLLIVALLNWGCVRLMERRRRGVRLALVSTTVGVHVLFLAFFKYYETLATWLCEQIGAGGEWLLSSTLTSLVMPIGLSFYTFQGLSYTIDHYREDGLAPRSFSDVLAFLSFFPTVMSGPIMREDNFFPQLRTSYAGEEDFAEGITLILSGLFKKVVMATYLQEHLVDAVFRNPGSYSSWGVLVGIYAYTIQIYCDFSGYTDMALGIGRLMGFHLPKNFDSPYRSLNLQEFWHRWHISLSTWLRDYLYISMGGSRRGNRYVNLIVTMLIGGLWHGSSLSFAIWGLLHGIGLAVVHAFHRVCKNLRWALPRWVAAPGKLLAWLLTLHFVAAMWVFFRADTYGGAIEVFRRLFACVDEGYSYPLLALVIITWGLLLQLCGPPLCRFVARVLGALPWPVQALLAGLCASLILNMGPEGTLRFIYTHF